MIEEITRDLYATTQHQLRALGDARRAFSAAARSLHGGDAPGRLASLRAAILAAREACERAGADAGVAVLEAARCALLAAEAPNPAAAVEAARGALYALMPVLDSSYNAAVERMCSYERMTR